MAVSVDRRKTLIVEEDNWRKYCAIKSQQLMNFGKPEMSFTEFANLCMNKTNLTLADLLNYKKQRRKK
jgi:hypothetical protein